MAGLNLSYAQSQDQGMQDELYAYGLYRNGTLLHGDIEKITISKLKYTIDSVGQITTSGMSCNLMWFNKIGKVTKIKYYGDDKSSIKLHYNRKNGLLSKIREFSSTLPYSANYYYDTNNRIANMRSRLLGINFSERYEYDNDGRLIKYVWGNDKKKEFRGSEVYVCDNNGNKIEAKGYNAENVLEERSTYRYDANNNEIEKCTYSAMGELIAKITRTIFYDKEARIKEEHVYDKGMLMLKIIYSYDAFNNIFKEEYHHFKDNGEVEVALSIYDIQYRK